MNHYLLITGMAIITFSMRYAFFSRRLPLQIGPRTERLLSFSAPAVMTALWVPIVFLPAESQRLEPEPAYLIAAGLAIALSLTRLSTLPVILLSAACFVVIHHCS